MGKFSITYECETREEMYAFLERNKDAMNGGETPAKSGKAGRPKKSEPVDPGDELPGEDIDDVDDLAGADEPEEQEEEATLENIRRMVSTKALDKTKKAAIVALLKKFGAENATKLPPAKYKAFFEKLKTI